MAPPAPAQVAAGFSAGSAVAVLAGGFAFCRLQGAGRRNLTFVLCALTARAPLPPSLPPPGDRRLSPSGIQLSPLHPRWKGAALAHCPCASEAGVSGTPAVSHREARQNSLEMPSTASGGSLAGGGGVRLPTPEGSAKGSPASQHTFHLRVA